jgi:hypothetical protein
VATEQLTRLPNNGRVESGGLYAVKASVSKKPESVKAAVSKSSSQ